LGKWEDERAGKRMGRGGERATEGGKINVEWEE